ncbi:hypothetical protein [Nonomuraea sp. WAC 01424]|uniref:hypothetical protein n=1 Tax=Nonomuraea sp. WAC 01424 TaxID=2203200 RepID=UPI000F7714A8|nr:hypothetical protein [Nonomuraea sp. WAC 01424]
MDLEVLIGAAGLVISYVAARSSAAQLKHMLQQPGPSTDTSRSGVKSGASGGDGCSDSLLGLLLVIPVVTALLSSGPLRGSGWATFLNWLTLVLSAPTAVTFVMKALARLPRGEYRALLWSAFGGFIYANFFSLSLKYLGFTDRTLFDWLVETLQHR